MCFGFIMDPNFADTKYSSAFRFAPLFNQYFNYKPILKNI